MELLRAYSSGDEDEAEQVVLQPVVSKIALNSAPHVDTLVDDVRNERYSLVDAKEIRSNLSAASLWAPSYGPAHPYKKVTADAAAGTSMPTGFYETAHVDGFTFDEQFHTFHNYGYGADPTGSGQMVGDQGAAAKRGAASAYSSTEVSALSAREAKRAAKRRKHTPGDAADVDGFRGPWASFHGEEEEKRSAYERGILTEQQKAYREELAKIAADKAVREGVLVGDEESIERGAMVPQEAGGRTAPHRVGVELGATSTKFHGETERDYQGRSWVEPPAGVKASESGDVERSYIPKKIIHTWTDHSKGVQSIQFIPNTGHLLMSGSMDGKCKIWSVHGDRRCMRTYIGHSGAVRQVRFNTDGSQFLSCSFDRYIKLWDVETGVAVSSFTNEKMCYCAEWYPVDNSTFLVGSSNKRIVQYDVRSGEITQEYDHHLNTVNSVTFCDEGRRFISTSDDKKIMIWEYNIPVPMKYISEPHMHSVPTVTMHPNGTAFAGQSLDNQIVVYTAGAKFKQLRKKCFRGHVVSGHACQIGFSPDGRFIMSGDGSGQLWFWDWKTHKVYRKLKAHTMGPTIGCIWHPLEPSRVATCGWDGLIKYWD